MLHDGGRRERERGGEREREGERARCCIEESVGEKEIGSVGERERDRLVVMLHDGGAVFGRHWSQLLPVPHLNTREIYQKGVHPLLSEKETA